MSDSDRDGNEVDAATELADLIGGRLLAWAGGLAVAIGLVLLAILTSAGHRIGIPARLGLAGGGALTLFAAACRLRRRGWPEEVCAIGVGAATLGMFATLAVTSRGYGYLPAASAVLASLAVGLGVTMLAIAWRRQAIGWLGLLGAVLSPLAVGAPVDGVTLALVAVALGGLLVAAVRLRWDWMALAGTLAALAQWGRWLLQGHPAGAELFVLGGFTGLALAAAVANGRRDGGGGSLPAALLVAVNAVLAGVLGRLALGLQGEAALGDLWLAIAGGLHLALGATRRLGLGVALRALLMAGGALLLDVAFGLFAHGLLLTAGWAAIAVGCAVLRRRSRADDDAAADRPAADGAGAGATAAGRGPSAIELAIGAHLALVLVRVALTVPDSLGGGRPAVGEVLATATLATACLASGWLVGPGRRELAEALHALAAVALAYLSAQALHGPALVGAWAAEAALLAELARRLGPGATRGRADRLRGASVAFLGLALGHVLLVEAPPVSLLVGTPALGVAALALAAVAAAALRAGIAAPRRGAWRPWLLTTGGAVILYLVSVAVVTLAGPALEAVEGFPGAMIALSARQQGQVALSVCWGAIGLGGIVVGLRRRQRLVLGTALGLLSLAVVKVFGYDLAALTSVYRIASLLGFGLLLLASAFAYGRLRPHADRPAVRDAPDTVR